MQHDQNSAPATTEERIVLFDSSEFAQLLGIRIIEARDGYARVVMPVFGKKNPNGVVHGGAIFTLADQAFAIAANAGHTNRVAVSVHIQFIAPARGDLTAISEVLGESRRYSTYRVMVYEGDRTIAQVDGVAIRISP
jgi:acyl-CoA thioesterase